MLNIKWSLWGHFFLFNTGFIIQYLHNVNFYNVYVTLPTSFHTKWYAPVINRGHTDGVANNLVATVTEKQVTKFFTKTTSAFTGYAVVVGW